MTFKTLISINGVLAIVSGIPCVLAPAMMLSTFGVTLTPMGLVVYQFWGATLAGMGMLAWSIRHSQVSSTQQAIAISLLTTNVLSAVMAVRGQFSGANSCGWFTVTLFSIFSVAWCAFAIGQRRKKTDINSSTEQR